MKASPADIEAMAKRLPDSDKRCVLLYGPNVGLIEALKAQLLASFGAEDAPQSFGLNEIKKTPALVADALAAEALFASRTAVLLRDVTDAALKAIEPAASLIQGRKDRLLLVLANTLTGSSKLKKAAEAHPGIAVAACYEENPAQLKAYLSEVAATAFGLRLGPQAAETLLSLVGDDRMVLRSALQSCALYAWGSTEVTAQHVSEALVSQTADSMDTALQAIFAGDLRLAARALDDLGTEASGLLIMCQRHAGRLHQVRADLDGGQPFQAASSRLRPPVFWKQRDSFQRQVQVYSLPVLKGAVIYLKDLTWRARAQQDSNPAFIAQGLLDLTARLAQASAKRA